MWRWNLFVVPLEEMSGCIRSVYSIYSEKYLGCKARERSVERTSTISSRFAACFSEATRTPGGCFSPTSCWSTRTPTNPSTSNSSLSVSPVSPFFILALSCSLTHLLAAQSPQFASSVHTFHQFITALASSRSCDGQKGLWSNYHIAEQLDMLLRADYTSLPVAVKEASIQRSGSEPSGVLQDAAVLRLLSNDHGNGNGTKLRVPFLSTVSIGSQLPFSRKLYTHLLKRLQEEENSVVLPNLFNLFPTKPEKPFAGLLDYWLLDGEQKQCSVKARDVVDLVVIERLPQTESLGDNGIRADVQAEAGGRIYELSGEGNGRLDAIMNALRKGPYKIDCDFVTYEEHALESESNARAAAYVALKDKKGSMHWGVGVHNDIIYASVNALLSAINRALAQNER